MLFLIYGNYSVAEIEPALQFLLVADGKHGCGATEGCKVAGSQSRCTVGDDTLHAHRLCGFDGAVGEELPHCAVGRHGYDDVVLPHLVLLSLFGYLRHGAHSLDGVVARCCLATEHESVSAIVDGIGDVGHLGTGGAGVVYHRVEHLRGYDYGFLCPHAFAYYAALYARDALYRHLDAKVATCNHYTVGCFDNLVDVIHTLLIFNL